MRDSKPGDLSVRLSFSRIMSPKAEGIFPCLEITDGTSGLCLMIELTAAQIAEMLAGGAAEVTADKVAGFGSVGNWGKYLKTMRVLVDVEHGDYIGNADPAALPHVAAAIAEVESAGYRCNKPRRNNAMQWVVTGRRYDDRP